MKKNKKTYTIDVIKKVFWEEFHDSGELWFGVSSGVDSEQENTEATNEYWESFLAHLEYYNNEKE